MSRHGRVALPKHGHPDSCQRRLSHERRGVAVSAAPAPFPSPHVVPGYPPAVVRVIGRADHEPPAPVSLRWEAGGVSGDEDTTKDANKKQRRGANEQKETTHYSNKAAAATNKQTSAAGVREENTTEEKIYLNS